LNLGAVLQRQGKFDDAIQCYRQVTAKFPDEVASWRRLADTLSAKGLASEVIPIYQQGLRFNSNDESLLLGLGNAYLAHTNYASAVDCFRDALKIEPSSAGLHYNLGLVLGLQGNPDAACLELQTALQLKPDFSAAQQRLQLLQQK
jgi:tetratricopeptide (TPR) repeat protein